MILHAPLIITARLMPGLQIENGTISLALPRSRAASGRDHYVVWIDLPDGSEHEIADLRSGCQGGSIQEGLASLLSFLGAAAESRRYRESTGQQGENKDLFPAAVVDWTCENLDEIDPLSYDLEEEPQLVE